MESITNDVDKKHQKKVNKRNRSKEVCIPLNLKNKISDFRWFGSINDDIVYVKLPV